MKFGLLALIGSSNGINHKLDQHLANGNKL